ncbi:MAG: hypothetical protein ACK41C_07960 [Phenylobacterium sp.]|jgi:hypothetical protein|uniref:hypothetical protein n=1 Tax=Phenylobacterium sp. TaxID=1871053 RepID=UPI00391B8028
MTLVAVGFLAIAVALVGFARRVAGRPPLWRAKAALGGAAGCVVAAIVLIAVDPTLMADSPILYIAAFGMFEGGLALISLIAAAGWSAPRWL